MDDSKSQQQDSGEKELRKMNEFQDDNDDEDIVETASCFEAIVDGPEPNLGLYSKKSRSADDVSIYLRYYGHLKQEHEKRDQEFSWNVFLCPLVDRLKSFKVTIPVFQKKPKRSILKLLRRFPSASSTGSKVSSETEGGTRGGKARKNSALSETPSVAFEEGSLASSSDRVESLLYSTNGLMSPSAQKNILKKMYHETKSYARRICKTMEKISAASPGRQLRQTVARGTPQKTCEPSSSACTAQSSSSSLLPKNLFPDCEPDEKVDRAKMASGEVTRRHHQPNRAKLRHQPREKRQAWRRCSPRRKQADVVGDVAVASSVQDKEKQMTV